jgi:tight adherence protein B
VLAGLVFGGLLLAMLLLVTRVGGSTRKGRLRQVEQFRLGVRGTPVTGRMAVDRPVGAFARTVGPAGPVAADAPAGQPASGAQRTMSPRQWLLVKAGAAVLGALLFGVLAGPVGVLLGALLGWLLAAAYPRLRERRRRDAFADQLPDALQLIVGSLRSGFSLAQAIDALIQDSPPSPLTVEFGRAIGEVRLGADLDDALERVAQRVGNEDLAWAVMAVRIQRETGGNLAEVLETTVETLRERDRLRRHVQALSAEGRLSAYILIALPFALAGWLLAVRRDYLSVLWTTSAGLTMLVGAGVLMAVGIVWMMRWMKVEV